MPIINDDKNTLIERIRLLFDKIGFHKFKTMGRYTRSGMADGKWIYQRRCMICGKICEVESIYDYK